MRTRERDGIEASERTRARAEPRHRRALQHFGGLGAVEAQHQQFQGSSFNILPSQATPKGCLKDHGGGGDSLRGHGKSLVIGLDNAGLDKTS